MDLLQKCAQEFDRLVPYQYHIIIGRKGKTLEFTISFDRADFHHLAGLHKLRDNVRLQTGKRIDIMKEILNGQITYNNIKQSIYFHEMAPRLLPLSQLELFLDSNEIIFRYNSKANIFSVIQADYLLQNDYEGTPFRLGHTGLPHILSKIRKGLCGGTAAVYTAQKRKTKSDHW